MFKHVTLQVVSLCLKCLKLKDVSFASLSHCLTIKQATVDSYSLPGPLPANLECQNIRQSKLQNICFKEIAVPELGMLLFYDHLVLLLCICYEDVLRKNCA